MKYYIGIDIGGTKCAVSLAGCDPVNTDRIPDILSKQKTATVSGKPYQTLDKLYSMLTSILDAHSLKFKDIEGIGISCGGPLDSRKGIVLSPPNLPGWDEIPVVEYFSSRTGVKTNLQNDANACAYAEWKFGAGRGSENMIFLTFGTGLGAGLVLGGKLYCGHTDMAGEIGHVRLTADGPVGYHKAGSCEGYCSGGGIAQLGQAAVKKELESGHEPNLLKTAGSIENINAKIIGDLADEGDELSIQVYRKSGEMLGYTLSILMDVINPDVIVIGSIFARSEHLLRPAMEEIIHREVLSYAVCPVVPAGLAEKVGDYAAIAAAML